MSNIRRLTTRGLFKALGWCLLVVTVAIPLAAGAQGWRDTLKAERAKNADRIQAIDQQAAPLGRELNQVVAKIQRHNDNPPAPPADQSNPGQVNRYNAAVEVYNAEARQLDGQRDRLVGILQPLAEESDALIARNKQIDARLNCTQVPSPCTSNSDCTCSDNCGVIEGSLGRLQVCQPRN